MPQDIKKPTMDDVLAEAGHLMEFRRQLGDAKGRQTSAMDKVKSADREVAEAQLKVDNAEAKFIKIFKESQS